MVMGGLDNVSGVLPVSNQLGAILDSWSADPSSEALDTKNLAEKLNDLTDPEKTESEAVPEEVVANILEGLGLDKDVPIGHSVKGLSVLSASPRRVPAYSSPITLIGSGFTESMVIMVGGKAVSDMTLDSGNKVTFTLPSLSSNETPFEGEVDLMVRHQSDIAELEGGILFGCAHSVCEQPALLNGCLL